MRAGTGNADDPRAAPATTRGGPLDATQTIVYYLWAQAFKQLNFGYGSAIAYALFGITLLITLAMIAYSRFAKVQAF